MRKDPFVEGLIILLYLADNPYEKEAASLMEDTAERLVQIGVGKSLPTSIVNYDIEQQKLLLTSKGKKIAQDKLFNKQPDLRELLAKLNRKPKPASKISFTKVYFGEEKNPTNDRYRTVLVTTMMNQLADQLENGSIEVFQNQHEDLVNAFNRLHTALQTEESVKYATPTAPVTEEEE